jgi:AAHS family 4-hydroxybenzoate transporter-like MFS transporter
VAALISCVALLVKQAAHPGHGTSKPLKGESLGH